LKSSKHYLFLMLAVPVSLAFAIVPQAQAKNTLNCTVVDETGKPVAKQEFILTSDKGKQSKKKTNDQGEAKFTGLDDGAYTIMTETPGFVASKSLPMEVSGNAEKPCKYTLVSATVANAKLQEVTQLVQQRKFADAETNAKKLLEMLPGEGAAHYVLALAYAYEGKQEAAEAVKKAAELSPERFKDKVIPIQMQALNVEAETAKQKNDFKGALQKYDAMLALSPNDSTVYYNMAVTYGRAGNFDQALKTIDKAIQAKPDDPENQKMKLQLQDLYLKQMDKKLEK
jgi:tetratricopeptide (TPR) repeat protein